MSRVVRMLRSRTLRWLPPALLLAILVEVGLRTTTLPRLCRWLGVALPLGRGAPLTGAGTTVDRARVRAAAIVLQRWPFARDRVCLRQALVTGCLLRRHRPQLHLGVVSRNGATAAHAWLVVDGVTLDAAAGDYVPLQGGTVCGST